MNNYERFGRYRIEELVSFNLLHTDYPEDKILIWYADTSRERMRLEKELVEEYKKENKLK